MRYANKLIGDYYSPNDVYIHSTDIDRTLMCAQLLAAGLFPPIGEQVWNNDINWQPIPIHTIPLNKEQLLTLMIPCPRFYYLFEEYKTSPEYKSVLQQYNSLIEHWKKESGQTLRTLADIFFLYDTLYVEHRKGLM